MNINTWIHRCISWAIIASVLGCDLVWAAPPEGLLRPLRASERGQLQPSRQEAGPPPQLPGEPPQKVPLKAHLESWVTHLRELGWWLKLHDRTREGNRWARFIAALLPLGGILGMAISSFFMPIFFTIKWGLVGAAFPITLGQLPRILAKHRFIRIDSKTKLAKFLFGLDGRAEDPGPLWRLIVIGLGLYGAFGGGPIANPVLTTSGVVLLVGGTADIFLGLIWPEELALLVARLDPSGRRGIKMVERLATRWALRHRLPFLSIRLTEELVDSYLAHPDPVIRDAAASLIHQLLQEATFGAGDLPPPSNLRLLTEVRRLEREGLLVWSMMESHQQPILPLRPVLPTHPEFPLQGAL